jgi:uncharacterized DUF497 family protein
VTLAAHQSSNREREVLHFDWDPAKAASNEAKHGVAFSEAATAFGDPLSLTIPDREHSEGEARFILLGVTYRGRLVVVAHAEADDYVRIISARPATNAERRSYEQED